MNVNMLLSSSGDVNAYILDIYTTSKSAVSLRKLKTSAVNCCEIRRSSDNTTTNILLENSGQITLSSTVSAGGTLASWIGSDDGFFLYDASVWTRRPVAIIKELIVEHPFDEDEGYKNWKQTRFNEHVKHGCCLETKGYYD